jgi:hypothetical protein
MSQAVPAALQEGTAFGLYWRHSDRHHYDDEHHRHDRAPPSPVVQHPVDVHDVINQHLVFYHPPLPLPRGSRTHGAGRLYGPRVGEENADVGSGRRPACRSERILLGGSLRLQRRALPTQRAGRGGVSAADRERPMGGSGMSAVRRRRGSVRRGPLPVRPYRNRMGVARRNQFDRIRWSWGLALAHRLRRRRPAARTPLAPRSYGARLRDRAMHRSSLRTDPCHVWRLVAEPSPMSLEPGLLVRWKLRVCRRHMSACPWRREYRLGVAELRRESEGFGESHPCGSDRVRLFRGSW